MLYMLDTNMASAAMRGDAALDRKLREATGASRRDRNCASVLRCVRSPCASRAWWKASSPSPVLRPGTPALPMRTVACGRNCLQGTPIGDFDEMIAAHALSLGAVMVTDSTRHFERVPGLEVQNWLRTS